MIGVVGRSLGFRSSRGLRSKMRIQRAIPAAVKAIAPVQISSVFSEAWDRFTTVLQELIGGG